MSSGANKTATISVVLVKPNKCIVARQRIKASDQGMRAAIFGMGGSSKRLGVAQIGRIGQQPLTVLGELPSEIRPGTPVWCIRVDAGLYAFAGPCAIYTNMGYGPANVGVGADELRDRITFDPDPMMLAEGLKTTLEARSAKK